MPVSSVLMRIILLPTPCATAQSKQHLFIYSALMRQIFQASAICVHIPGTVLLNHTVPRQNTVPVFEASSSSGCVVSVVQPCFINTNLSPATHFTLARQPFHFIPALCKLISAPTDFAPAQTTQKKLRREKNLCAVLCHLPIQHNLMLEHFT